MVTNVKDVRESLRDYYEVRLDDNYLNEKLDWCLKNCQSYFRDIKEDRRRVWYFKIEEDALMFSIKWS